MKEKKQKAAEIAVQKVIKSMITTDVTPLQTNNAWASWGKQTIMINRNSCQLRKKNK